ncbi:MAG: FtsH protease activity modulator HflK [gamma proteobacterium symbiont of Bathyaustriella thionipta]|nr:FtsH protease activity modulator HflK [gamma proteobacterium symbiont of Bathyaustriella thionipta]
MAWNEPGGGKKDPWSGGGDQGPPDLDEVVKKLQARLGGLFGGKKRSDNSDSGMPAGGGIAVTLVGVLLLLFWMASGFYTVEPAERGVELRLGVYKRSTPSGWHWHMPYPLETVIKVNVDRVSSLPHQATMLTRDENIVDIQLTVQYRINDPVHYLFKDASPIDVTLPVATETAVRETIGQNDLDYILTQGRSEIALTIKDRLQKTLKQYQSGIEVVGVNTQPAKPPEQVKAAFDDAIKAREDKERSENKAHAYANEIIPRARGGAARRVEDAKAYRDKVIARSEGEADRFLALMTEYHKAPEVTRKRLYMGTLEDVMAKTGKVMVDGGNSSNLMYLPIDQMMKSKPVPLTEGSGQPARRVEGYEDSIKPLSTSSNSGRPQRSVRGGR